VVSLGQLAYEAYSENAHGQSLISGAKLPPWLELPAGIIDAWEAAAQAVKMEVTRDAT
jgi:hypothetical protein